MRFIVLCATVLVLSTPTMAQVPIDTVLAWNSYHTDRQARVRVFLADDDARPYTAVIDEQAENPGAPVTDEVRYLAETVGRTLGFDPAAATFVFRFTAASFTPDGRDAGKVLLVRATFRRTDSGDLGTPSWRVITREALDDLTDRAFR